MSLNFPFITEDNGKYIFIYPNGKGIEINHIFGTPEDMIPYTKTDGKYKNGYLDGQTMKWTIRNDGTKQTYSFTAVYGKPVFIEDENTLFFVHGAKKKDS